MTTPLCLHSKGRPLSCGPSFGALLVMFLAMATASFRAEAATEPEFGVLRVWRADCGQKCNSIGPGEGLVVEVKDFSGWVIRAVEKRGYFEDAAIDSSDDVRKIVENHVFEAANAAKLALDNAVEGDVDTLDAILGDKDMTLYAKALLTAEGKWSENEAPKDYRRDLEKRRSGEMVFSALMTTNLFLAIAPMLPQNDQKQPDPEKSLRALDEVSACAQDLIHRARAGLHPKIDDVVLADIVPSNPEDAQVDRYQRPKASVLSDYEWLHFPLAETDQNSAAWQELRRSGLFKHAVDFTLVTTIGGRTVPLDSAISITEEGAPTSESLAAGGPEFFLQIASPLSTFGAIGIFSIILISFFLLASATDLVCDTNDCVRADGVAPYSLARGQMAFWFLVIIGASLFLWIATGTWHILNQTCLWLIGIGSGTALGSAVISEADPSANNAALKNPLRRNPNESPDAFKVRLAAEIKNVAARIAIPPGEPAAPSSEEKAALIIRGKALGAQQLDIAAMPARAWRRVLQDWLTDSNVYSFHRYQMLAWTLVLGLFFIAKVCKDRQLPDFDTTTFALLGITSGTYLGFKLQKSQS